MEEKVFTKITVITTVNAPVDKVWTYWTSPDHITQWNHASEDWHSPWAENDLREGGTFRSRMEAKDGSFGFDFEGVYENVIPNELIAYAMADGRRVEVLFKSQDTETKVIETFDAESENPLDMQRMGWQSILDNFKKYVENN